jgi:integrase
MVDGLSSRRTSLAGDPTIWRSRRRAAASLRNGNFRRNVFDAAAARAGIEGVTPYGLRHTAASLAIASGATVVLVCRMLGHSSPSVT